MHKWIIKWNDTWVWRHQCNKRATGAFDTFSAFSLPVNVSPEEALWRMLSRCQPKARLLTEDPRPKGTRKKKHFTYLTNIPPLSGETHFNWALYWHLAVILLRAGWSPQSSHMAVKGLIISWKCGEKELLVTPTVRELYHSNKQQTHICPLDGSKYIWGHWYWGLHCFTTDFTFIHPGVIKKVMRKLSRDAFINILRFSAHCTKPPMTTYN